MTDKLMQAVERAKSGFFGADTSRLDEIEALAKAGRAYGPLTVLEVCTALRASLARIDAMQETLGRLASPVPFCDARAASENPRVELETRMAVARAALETQP